MARGKVVGSLPAIHIRGQIVYVVERALRFRTRYPHLTGIPMLRSDTDIGPPERRFPQMHTPYYYDVGYLEQCEP